MVSHENAIASHDRQIHSKSHERSFLAPASVSGGTMTTHTDDCLNCDFRIAKIPAKDHPAGSMRPIYTHRAPYPRFLDSSGNHGATFTPENTDMDIYPWVEGEGDFAPIASIPQVAHTYAYIDGGK